MPGAPGTNIDNNGNGNNNDQDSRSGRMVAANRTRAWSGRKGHRRGTTNERRSPRHPHDTSLHGALYRPPTPPTCWSSNF
eukprot:ctg_7164.g670